jgi:hypothetical protein
MAERSIHEMEKEATGVAHREIAAPLAAAINVLNLATKLQANDSPVKRLSKAVIVRLLLLQRIQNDLRCCIILVEHGYSLQAASLAAGIFDECFERLPAHQLNDLFLRELVHPAQRP